MRVKRIKVYKFNELAPDSQNVAFWDCMLQIYEGDLDGYFDTETEQIIRKLDDESRAILAKFLDKFEFTEAGKILTDYK